MSEPMTERERILEEDLTNGFISLIKAYKFIDMYTDPRQVLTAKKAIRFLEDVGFRKIPPQGMPPVVQDVQERTGV